MSRVQLYLDLGSQPSRSVWWLCKLLDVPHDLHVLRLDKGDTRTPEYARIHPQGRVPAVVYDDKPLIESSAIMIWMCQRFGGGRFYPSDPDAQQGINAYLAWHSEFRNAAAGLFATTVMRAVMKGQSSPPETVAKLEKRLHGALHQLESYWLGGQPFIRHDRVSIADLQCVNELNQVLPFYPAVVDDFPAVRAWVARMEAVPYYQDMMVGWKKVAQLLANRRAKL